MNLQSIYELCKIAEGLKQLKVLMHVSTTYCYPNRFDVDEKVVAYIKIVIILVKISCFLLIPDI